MGDEPVKYASESTAGQVERFDCGNSPWLVRRFLSKGHPATGNFAAGVVVLLLDAARSHRDANRAT